MSRPGRTAAVQPKPGDGRLRAFTDGSTWKGQPGPIAWGVVFVRGRTVEREVGGGLWRGSNNRAELAAIVVALEHEQREDLTVMSDSATSVGQIRARRNGEHDAIINLDMWERFDAAIAIRTRRGLRTGFRHIKGHGSNRYNKRADRLARAWAAVAFGDMPLPEEVPPDAWLTHPPERV